MNEFEKAELKRNHEAKQKATEAADILGNFVNPFQYDSETFINRIVYRTHRTLQQSLCKLIIKLLREWATCYENRIYDLRNEATCKLCHNIVKTMQEKDEYWDNLPTV